MSKKLPETNRIFLQNLFQARNQFQTFSESAKLVSRYIIGFGAARKSFQILYLRQNFANRVSLARVFLKPREMFLSPINFRRIEQRLAQPAPQKPSAHR